MNPALAAHLSGLTPDRRTGRLSDDDAYEVLVLLLAAFRALGFDRTTPDGLHAAIASIDTRNAFGGRRVLHILLREAASHHQIRITAAGHILLRTDAPSDGGPEHTWIRLQNRRGAEVEIVGADPWPDTHQVAPGPAWWRCTGCRATSGTDAQDLEKMRAQAVEHADDCLALPTPLASPQGD
ncbi:hypothetical protein [Streptomyces sp. NRRL B-24484]|uniref:hypothetical protein n=1 Tax=Streptomyces sp. NRRL B-24484 TaxID=1463833 RepID=UPI0004BF18C1|nr:hypothetical protein [Streptomyces sp. NRRL B-24484]